MGESAANCVKPSLLRLAASRLKQISQGELSAEVRQKASLCLIDFLGAAQIGLLNPLRPSILDFSALHAGKPEAYVFCSDSAICAETAAFANSILAHSAARDDMHLESCAHLGSMVVSAALALAQRDGWSGEQLLRGLVGGYEMGAFLGAAIRASGTFNTHFRASGLIGAFAATAAAATAASADEETTISALSLAVNMAAGINEWAWAGGREIFIHNGIASRAGITSFDLARSGIKASDTVLEGKDGFFKALNAGDGAANVFRGLVETSPVGRCILQVRFKPAACCNFAQTSSSIAVKISRARSRALDVDDVDAVKITTTTAAISYPGCDNAGPLESPSQGKLSIQFGVCTALVHASLDEESLMSIRDPKVAVLMKKCTLLASPENDASYTKGLQPASVEVSLKDGTVLRESAPDVPWLDGSEVAARFLQEVAPMAPGQKGEQMLELCQKFQSADIGNKLFGS